MAKVLIINGSPRVGGNTSIALSEMANVFEAEGVETERQIEYLRKEGCDLFQGYYYSQPVSVEEFRQKYL